MWDASTLSKNRERLPDGGIAARFLSAILARLRIKYMLSNEYFPSDGAPIEAWCSRKNFHPKDEAGTNKPPADGLGGRNGEVHFRSTRRRNATHASTTDPDARLYRNGPGAGARLCYMDHVPMENPSGLAVDAETMRATGFAERLTPVAMLDDSDRAEGTRSRWRRTARTTPATWSPRGGIDGSPRT